MQIIFLKFIFPVFASSTEEEDSNLSNLGLRYYHYSLPSKINFTIIHISYKVLKTSILNNVEKIVEQNCNETVKTKLKNLLSDEKEVRKLHFLVNKVLKITGDELKLVLEIIDDPPQELYIFFANYLNTQDLPNEELKICITFYLKSIKLYIDLRDLNKPIEKKNTKDNEQLSYRIFLNLDNESLINELKILLKDYALFFVKNYYQSVDLIRICATCDKNGDYPFNIGNILVPIISDFFTGYEYIYKVSGILKFNPKVEMSDPRMPYCVSLKVDDFECSTFEEGSDFRFNFNIVMSRIKSQIKFLKNALEVSLSLKGFEPLVYDKEGSELAIHCKNGLTFTCKTFDQGNSSLYTPLFFFNGVNEETSILLKTKINNIAKFRNMAYKTFRVIELCYEKRIQEECNSFFSIAKNSFEELVKNTIEEPLSNENLIQKDCTSNISKRESFLEKTAFNLLICHKGTVLNYMDKLNSINDMLRKFSKDKELEFTIDHISDRIDSLNSLYGEMLE